MLCTGIFLGPPAAAFGAYFGGWHAVRHTARLLALTPAGPGRDTPARVLGRFARSAALPSAAALAVLALLWSRRRVADPAAAVAVLLALTFPHAAVVGWLDRRLAAALRSG
jgi:Beta-carotene 15,15'-dioxygenase